jgi:hypothetical protein
MNLPTLKGLGASGKRRSALGLLCLTLGLSGTAYSQALAEVPQSTSLWREWMATEQREPSQTSSARIYLTTEREVTQTGPDSAQFQSGRYSFMLADGSVPDVDGDVDGYTDLFEDSNGSNRNDPAAIPVDGDGNPLPTDATTYPTVVLGNGDLIGVSNTTTVTTGAGAIDPKRGDSSVRIIGAPPSNMVRNLNFKDYSGEFYYYDADTGYSQQFPLSLYYYEKDFPNPTDVGAMEDEIVYGMYQVEYPTLINAPLGRGAVSVVHNLVPNGSLTNGLRRPNWLIRSLKLDERRGAPPVKQSWVNGRLKFDPYLPMILEWDSLAGLSTPLDFIDLWIEDGDGRQISYRFRMGAGETSKAFDMSSLMRLQYGDIKEVIADPTGPLPINGNIVMRYFRLANLRSSADLSSVTVRVPVELAVSYPSWRLEWFPTAYTNDGVAGPNADPDFDGFTNQQEFEQGTDPVNPRIAIALRDTSALTATSVTLNAASLTDGSVTITDRGFVYAQTSVNPNPQLNGPGVTKVANLTLPGVTPANVGAYESTLTGLSQGTQYSYKAYVVTSAGTFYTAAGVTFTTPIAPVVVSPSLAQLAQTSAVLGGWVFDSGDSVVTERGVVYAPVGLNPDPMLGGTDVVKVSSGSGTGVFSVSVGGLSLGTTYNFKAYALNKGGVSYSLVRSFSTPATLATVNSPVSAAITGSSAVLGATVASDGGAAIVERGIVLSPTALNADPLVGAAGVVKVASPGTTGAYTVDAIGLLPATQYSFKGFASTSVGTSYTAVIGVFTTSDVPRLSQPTGTEVLARSAVLGGTIDADGGASVIQRGVVFSETNSAPQIGGAGVVAVPTSGTSLGAFSFKVQLPKAGTRYYFRPYAINSVGTAYSAVVGEVTTLTLALVTTPTSANVTGASATLGGTVENDGGAPVTQRGVVLSATNPNPEIGGANVVVWAASGTLGVFTVETLDLLPTTGYAFKAFAVTSRGIAYSPVGLFITPSLASLSTPTIASLSGGSVVLGATVTADGGTPITERGVIYSRTSINPNPLIGGADVVQLPTVGATGAFTVPVTGLVAATGYTFRAYAVNAAGTAYGTTAAFFTTSTTPSVVAPVSSAIAGTSAVLGGNVTNDNGFSITERGVVVSTIDANPEIGKPGVVKFSQYGTTGSFTVDATGLAGDTVYYFRAYAVNQGGAGYSSTATFRTLPFLLGGAPNLQWQNSGQQTQGAVQPGQNGQTVSVPEFFYQKNPANAAVAIAYQVETSTDCLRWSTIDATRWQVDEFEDSIRARWIPSAGTPPTRIFFRVRGDLK